MSTVADVVLDTARRGELHHALILQGPSAQSLREFALSIARTLNCPNGTTGDDCHSCQKIDRNSHPDVHLVTVGEERKMISADQVRELVSGASMRPYEGRTKVFILDPADATSPAAMNALLKTLEEPVADTVFLLLTRSADLLLPTIRSRSQVVFVGRAPSARENDGDVPLQLARLRRRAEEMGSDPEWSAALAGEILDWLERALANGETAALLRAAARIAADDERQAIAVYAGVLRDLAALEPGQTLDPPKARRIAAAVSKERLLAAADLAVRAIPRLVVNPDPRLLIEQSLIELTKK